MANRKMCPPCRGGQFRDCWKVWQGPSERGEALGGTKPRQSIYTFKCPTEAVQPAAKS